MVQSYISSSSHNNILYISSGPFRIGDMVNLVLIYVVWMYPCGLVDPFVFEDASKPINLLLWQGREEEESSGE